MYLYVSPSGKKPSSQSSCLSDTKCSQSDKCCSSGSY
ncbi:MAG TPA: hypothetical protein DDW76_06355 [Cyanobacteria bacterium UBA11369]|nr:hypothetical protein [Cyanobacteria bacterium UBA11371]HBE29812.1 hypothetical protein [Cyanobacteria bacterium UBA11368]HBE48427.1 hypothetical protein [Cyanobacteria bacterium UBA11369]